MLDPFNYGQGVPMGTRDPRAPRDEIGAHRYSVIHANLAQTSLPPAIVAAISEHYRQAGDSNDIHVPAGPGTKRAAEPVSNH